MAFQVMAEGTLLACDHAVSRRERTNETSDRANRRTNTVLRQYDGQCETGDVRLDFRVFVLLLGRMATLLFREYQINIRLRIAAPLDTDAASGMFVFSLFRNVLLLVLLPIRSK